MKPSQVSALPTSVGLSAVWATSPNEAWAVDNRTDPLTVQAWKFVLHWDGSIWKDYPCT